ncbi:MAG: beta-N-acetylhexosaminidase [Acidobacteriota bacterium]
MDNSGLSDPKKMIGQLFMIGIGGISLSEEEKDFIRNENIGFIILFSRNFSSPDQLRELTSEIHKLTSPPPAVFIDQEGGPIVRLGESGSTVVSHMALAATGNKKNAERAGKIIGKDMRTLGIDGVFAPVMDVNSRKDNPVIGIRSFSDDPLIVSEYGTEFFLGLKKGKTLGCGKHFPGHGHTASDSHLEIPVSEIDNNFLSKINLPPFKKLISKGINSLMTAHVRFPLISEKLATFSPEITIELLRESMKFHGVLFSDCIEMSAVNDNYSPEEIIAGFNISSLDVISVSHSLPLQKDLIELMKSNIESGNIERSRLQKSLDRISALKKEIKKKSIRERFKSKKLRKNYKLEKKIAEESITVLKNSAGLIPLSRKRKILIVDQRKSSHSANLSNKEDNNSLWSIGNRLFSKCEILIPENDFKISENEKRQILKYDHIIILDHSWRNIPDKSIAMDIIKLRSDSILVCANNPYIAENFSNAGTIVLTYGSRNIQVEALFCVLSGRKKPKGTTPVKISI